MTAESFVDSFKHFVGVETAREKKQHSANQHLAKGEEAAMTAAHQLYRFMLDELSVAGDYSAEKAGDLRQLTAEQLSRFGEYAKRKAAEGYEVSKDAAAQTYDEVSAKASELTQQGIEIGKDAAAKGYEYSKDAAAKGFEYSKEAAAQGYEYSKDAAAQGLEYGKDAAAQGLEYSKEAAAQGLEYSKEAAAQGYEYSKDAAAKGYEIAHRKIAETVSELPQNAGHTVTRFKDELGDLYERISSPSGDYYERMIKEPIEETADSAKGVFGKIGSWFHHSGANARETADDAARSASAQYEYVKDSVGDYVLKAKDGAESVGDKAQQTWDDLFNSKDWQHYFKRNPKLDESWWRSYFSSSNFSPRTSAQHWKDYVQSFSGGPKKLDQFWRNAEHKGYAAKDSARNKYYRNVEEPVKSKWQSIFGGSAGNHLGANASNVLGSSDSSSSGYAATAPVGLFWASILALYLLFLAKRIFEQKRAAALANPNGSASAVREKGPSPTPSSTANEKFTHLSSVAQASSDSLSTFAIYAPATTILLIAHELNGVVGAPVLHGIYTALFAGQFLQNESSLVHDAKARGLGVYLSWGAAGVAGVAGMLYSVGQAF